MTITVTPTELKPDGSVAIRSDRALQFESEAQAREALATTVAELMRRADLSYSISESLEDNVERYYSATGHSFGWIMEGPGITNTDDAGNQIPSPAKRKAPSPLAIQIYRVGFMLLAVFILHIAMPPIENAVVLLGLASKSGAALISAAIRAAAILVLLFTLTMTILRLVRR